LPRQHVGRPRPSNALALEDVAGEGAPVTRVAVAGRPLSHPGEVTFEVVGQVQGPDVFRGGDGPHQRRAAAVLQRGREEPTGPLEEVSLKPDGLALVRLDLGAVVIAKVVVGPPGGPRCGWSLCSHVLPSPMSSRINGRRRTGPAPAGRSWRRGPTCRRPCGAQGAARRSPGRAAAGRVPPRRRSRRSGRRPRRGTAGGVWLVLPAGGSRRGRRAGRRTSRRPRRR